MRRLALVVFVVLTLSPSVRADLLIPPWMDRPITRPTPKPAPKPAEPAPKPKPPPTTKFVGLSFVLGGLLLAAALRRRAPAEAPAP